MVSNNRSNSLSVVAYTLQRLADLGIDRVFGVPGDYSFPINDAVEENSQLTWVASANELNAAYAADGYARRRGAAILATTYGVGELSAINGVMGSLAEKLPRPPQMIISLPVQTAAWAQRPESPCVEATSLQVSITGL